MTIQHDHHLIPWLKAKFNLTVKDQEYYYNSNDWYLAYEGDYDLDIKSLSGGPSVMDIALEYSAYYNEAMNNKLVELEMGNKTCSVCGVTLTDQDTIPCKDICSI